MTRRTCPKPRAVASGDIAPRLRPRRCAVTASGEATIAANTATAQALTDLDAVIAGASPDELVALRRLLRRQHRDARRAQRDADDAELAPDWRSGGYPYRHLMSRDRYEEQKYRLQVELLKLQAWVKDTGERIVILFEGRDAAGKGGTIKRFMEHLNLAVRARSRPRETPAKWSAASGTQRYVQHSRRRAARSRCSIASWYNRAGVERVMGFAATPSMRSLCAKRPSLNGIPARSGLHLFKFWAPSVSQWSSAAVSRNVARTR
ncbi:MAG: hypothetical protein R3E65_10240 [Steroidobacteraceae bacterium]